MREARFFAISSGGQTPRSRPTRSALAEADEQLLAEDAHRVDQIAGHDPPLLAGGERTPFVGRVTELEELRRCWERVRAGERQLFLLAGEPGIGKTRLAAELATVAHAGGATVLFGRADEGALVPFQPFVESLSYHLEASEPHRLSARLRTASTALAALLQDLPATGRNGDEYRFVDAVTSFLLVLGGVGAVVD